MQTNGSYVTFFHMFRFDYWLYFTLLAIVVQRPCYPSPCGPNSQCREINGQGVCSCIQGFIGSPPSCRPECVINSECPLNEACINQKCIDPCPGSCGQSGELKREIWKQLFQFFRSVLFVFKFVMFVNRNFHTLNFECPRIMWRLFSFSKSFIQFVILQIHTEYYLKVFG